ncbi:MAG: hypothetical protein K2X93_08515 [Candidatus Obscuribacterales bacterium]|nr:hypothetical protein [Candidatus Obscuribacterales bacterium]
MDSGDISGNTPDSEKAKSNDSIEEAKVSTPEQEASSVPDSVNKAESGKASGQPDSVAAAETPAKTEEPSGAVPAAEKSASQEQTSAASKEQPDVEPPAQEQPSAVASQKLERGTEEPAPQGQPAVDESVPYKPYPWIIHPVVDYLFVAGGLAIILIAANYFILGWKVPVDRVMVSEAPFVITMYFCQHLFSNTHNVVTYIRLFNTDEAKRKYRFYRTWLAYGFIAILGLCAFVLPGEFSTGLSFLFTITIFSHFCMQAYGISKIYCYKRGYMLSDTENEIFRWLMISMGTYFSSSFFLRRKSFRLVHMAQLSPSGF